jgi:hypothetical protein
MPAPGFARASDMEPGFRFVSGGVVLTFVGVERVVSRFAGKRRVRVLTKEGVSWVDDFDTRFLLMPARVGVRR